MLLSKVKRLVKPLSYIGYLLFFFLNKSIPNKEINPITPVEPSECLSFSVSLTCSLIFKSMTARS